MPGIELVPRRECDGNRVITATAAAVPQENLQPRPLLWCSYRLYSRVLGVQGLGDFLFTFPPKCTLDDGSFRAHTVTQGQAQYQLNPVCEAVIPMTPSMPTWNLLFRGFSPLMIEGKGKRSLSVPERPLWGTNLASKFYVHQPLLKVYYL